MTSGRPSEPTTPRLAASVLLVRNVPEGIEVFMVLRHQRSRTHPSMFVYPGGTVRHDDRVEPDQVGNLAATFRDRVDVSVEAETAGALYCCATRELFEEAGVLLAHEAGNWQAAPVAASAEAAADQLMALRTELQRGEISLDQAMQRERVAPAFGKLVPFSRWVTPVGREARFDTWFFVAEMPAAQEALHCDVETTAGLWLSPEAALDGASSGAYPMILPTVKHLSRIQPFRHVAELLAFAALKPIRTVQPELALMPDGTMDGVMPPDLEDRW